MVKWHCSSSKIPSAVIIRPGYPNLKGTEVVLLQLVAVVVVVSVAALLATIETVGGEVTLLLAKQSEMWSVYSSCRGVIWKCLVHSLNFSTISSSKALKHTNEVLVWVCFVLIVWHNKSSWVHVSYSICFTTCHFLSITGTWLIRNLVNL